MLSQGQLISKVETIVWAIPSPGVTLDELIIKLTDLGYSILEVDRENYRLQVLHIVEVA